LLDHLVGAAKNSIAMRLTAGPVSFKILSRVAVRFGAMELMPLAKDLSDGQQQKQFRFH
jgi:hypothetical protein